MKHLSLTLALSLASLFAAPCAQATMSPAQRYDADKKICARENSSTARMRCLRDASAEYDRNLRINNNRPYASSPIKNTCAVCAKVVSVRVMERQGKGSGLGVIGGGVAGALLGNQIGGGHGRQLATVAGAAGGAYAGNQVEKNMRATKVWIVSVQYENGGRRQFEFASNPHFSNGQLVRNHGNSIVRR